MLTTFFGVPSAMCCCQICSPVGGVTGLCCAAQDYCGCQHRVAADTTTWTPVAWMRREYCCQRSWTAPIVFTIAFWLAFVVFYLPITLVCAGRRGDYDIDDNSSRNGWKLVPTCYLRGDWYGILGWLAGFSMSFALVCCIVSVISTLFCGFGQQGQHESSSRSNHRSRDACQPSNLPIAASAPMEHA